MMKFHIEIEVNDLGDLERVQRAVEQLGAALAGTAAPDEYADADVVEAEEASAAAKKKKKAEQAKKRREAKKAEEKKKAEAAEIIDDDPFGLEADTVTLSDLKTALQAHLEIAGLEGVKTIFAACGAEKISEIKPEDYAKALAMTKA